MADPKQFFTDTPNASIETTLSSRWMSQSFTTTDAYDIDSVKILLFKDGSPGTVTASIRDASGDLPIGGDLAVGAINGDNLTEDSSGEWAEITFASAYSLSAATKYTIVVRGSGFGLNWTGRTNAPLYAGGDNKFSFNSGGSWSSNSGVQDHNFQTFEAPPEIYKVVNPGPEDDAIDINRVTNLTWEVGEETADDYDVWFGTPGNMVLVATNLTNKFFSIDDYLDPDKLDLDTEYEWRIDSYVGGELVATGDVWSYTTRAQRTVILSSPDDLSENNYTTGILISWTIDGIGAQYGSFEDQDFLFIYVRKDDANFTEDDLVGNFVQAFVNDDLTISRLEYNTTYYWQVQAGNTAADLADSEVQSFTTMTFRPPAVPTGGEGGDEPIGINNMLTRKRFIAAANNKIWYEDI